MNVEKYKNQETHFSILVIGKPSSEAFIGLRSIYSIQNVRVCALADEAGRIWCKEISDQYHWTICLHQIPTSYDWVLEEFKETTDYREFGDKKFFRLMFLKWVLVSQCLNEKQQTNFIVFSDLDVLWNKNPTGLVNEFAIDSSLLALQDDSNNSREYFCPGIMIWKVNYSSNKILEEIMEFHLKELQRDPYLPDDKALNKWIKTSNNRKYVFNLPANQFVIGHKFLNLLFDKDPYTINDICAFHANYTIGHHYKYLKMKLIERSGLANFGRILLQCLGLTLLAIEKTRKYLSL